MPESSSDAALPSAPKSQPIDHKAVGERLRHARKARGLTLMALSELSGIAVSTISKAERGDIALTYDKFVALTHALQVEVEAIFGRGRSPRSGAVAPSFTAAGQHAVYDTPNYEYGMLANELAGKRMLPMLARIHARSVDDFPQYIRHGGEEFVYLLRGALELRFENGTVFSLAPGDSLYFDSSVGHVYISTGDGDAEAVVCCVDDDAPRPTDAI